MSFTSVFVRDLNLALEVCVRCPADVSGEFGRVRDGGEAAFRALIGAQRLHADVVTLEAFE